MFSVVLRDLLLFLLALGGLTLPAWSCLTWSRGIERLTLAIAAALIIGYLALFSLYVAGLPLRWLWALSAAGALYALVRPGALVDLYRDASLRGMLARWLLLALWCLGFQSLVVSYSGAGWAGDWLEHYDRAHFFLQHWPTGFLFLDVYPLPARPPLINLWAAGLLAQTGGSFAHYQVMITLLSSLVIFPLTVLLNRSHPEGRTQYLLLILLMACPLFVQNATFPWTKLGSAFFVLLAITQLSPGAGAPTSARMIAGAVLLAAGMLAHYSAGPWICALGAGGIWIHRHRWREPDFRRSLLFATLAAGLLCITWFGWSMAVYGPTTTFTENTAVAMSPGGTVAERALRAVENLWFTVTPIATNTDVPLLRQTSTLGQWRDYWFLLYQLKLPFAFGLAGGSAILWLLLRAKWSQEVNYWLIVVPLIMILGTATHAQPDRFGLTHISLQPLVLLGLTWLAAQADRLPRWLAWVWTVGLAVDLGLGISLHFAVQSFSLERWLHPGLGTGQYVAAYTAGARINWHNKSLLNLRYLGDIVTPTACILTIIAAGATAGILFLRSPKRASTPTMP